MADEATPMNHHLAARIGVLTITGMVAWNLMARGPLRALPAVLVGVSIATGTTLVLGLDINHVTVRDDLLAVIHLPTSDQFAHMLDTSMLAEALALAAIASVETLLSATAADQLHRGPPTRYNRELFAQGVGNVLSGLLGAFPVTGVIVRSAANVQAGARTPASPVCHGLWLLLFVAFLPFILRLIPTASLGAVLVFTGYKLVNLQAIRDLARHGRDEVLIYVGTLVTIVTTNLLTGVLVGIGLTVAKLIYTTQNLNSYYAHDRDGRFALHLEGVATFVSLPKLASALEIIPPHADVVIHTESLVHIDHACLNLLENWRTLHETTGGHVSIDWDRLRRQSDHRSPSAGRREPVRDQAA